MKTFVSYPMKSKKFAEILEVELADFHKLVRKNKEAIGERAGHYWTPKQIAVIVDLYNKSQTNEVNNK